MSKISDKTQSGTQRELAATHQRKKSKFRTVCQVILASFLAVFLFFSAAFATAYIKLQGSIKQHDISNFFTTERPEPAIPLDRKAGQPLNILVLGSDSRQGLEGYEDSAVEGMRSDTAMLLHISADRKRADVVSIPRDTLVDIPSCVLPDGNQTWPQSDAMFNSAFTLGGSTGDVSAAAACTLQTVEQMTDVLIDGFIVVNFISFRDVVNAIGGVEMCFNRDIKDQLAELSLEAGCHQLDGDTALAFARARYSLGDGSDISRIGRQQELVGKIAEKIFAMNAFTDLPKLYQLASSVLKNLDTSTGLGNIDWLVGLLYSMRNMNTSDVNFVTMPSVPDTQDVNRVRPTKEASKVWDALREDKTIPESALIGQRMSKDRVTTDHNSSTPKTPSESMQSPSLNQSSQNQNTRDTAPNY